MATTITNLEPSTGDAQDDDNERSWTGPEPEPGRTMADGGGGCDVRSPADGEGPPANHDDRGLDSDPAKSPAAAAALVCAIRSNLPTRQDIDKQSISLKIYLISAQIRLRSPAYQNTASKQTLSKLLRSGVGLKTTFELETVTSIERH
jgi:hypothetical protein